MNAVVWIGLAGLAVNVMVLLLSLSWRGGSWTGNERRRVGELEKDLKEYKLEVERRFNDAGEKTSDAWTFVQGLESKIIRDFASRELTDERFSENRREHNRYDAAIASGRSKADSGR